MKRRGEMRPATADELAAVWPAARASGVFDSAEEMRRFWERAPWRIAVTPGGEAAVLQRWRAHLDVCAVKALWCDSRRIPDLLADIGATARDQGFDRLLSPLVPPEGRAPYERAGMVPFERIITLRRNMPFDLGELDLGRVRTGSVADASRVLAVDALSFDEFWRYDPETLGGYLGTERLAVAEEEGRAIGYTLSTVKDEVGTLGRLAVVPSERGRGIGAALLAESLQWMARRGVRSATLCTQEHNTVSRGLYARFGFRELPGRLMFLLSETLSEHT